MRIMLGRCIGEEIASEKRRMTFSHPFGIDGCVTRSSRTSKEHRDNAISEIEWFGRDAFCGQIASISLCYSDITVVSINRTHTLMKPKALIIMVLLRTVMAAIPVTAMDMARVENG